MKHRKFSARENYVINLFLNKSPLILVSGVVFHLDKEDNCSYFLEYNYFEDNYCFKFKKPWELIIEYIRYKSLSELGEYIKLISDFAKASGFKFVFIYASCYDKKEEKNYSPVRHKNLLISMEELLKNLKEFNLDLSFTEEYLSWKVG